MAEQRGRAAEPGPPPLDPRMVELLYELCPPGYRNHELLRRYPVVLVRMARQHIEASLAALRVGYSRARLDLRDHVPVHAVEPMLAMYEAIGADLHQAAARVVEIERAMLRSATPPAGLTRTRPTPARGTIGGMDSGQEHDVIEPRWIPDELLDELLADADVTGDLAELRVAVTDERIYAHAVHGDAATG
ncbi:hypothetical protein [Embleya sp. NPDC005971]|uniref:hypothetical protein n=1 Tax=Embleya sp. NPDC005971 TaxID=3156724 RepID=UPI0033E61F3C